jgi:hypothetical protein
MSACTISLDLQLIMQLHCIFRTGNNNKYLVVLNIQVY